MSAPPDPGPASEIATREPAPATDGGWWSTFRGWPRAGRVASYVVVGIVLVLVAVTVIGLVLVRRPLPQTGGELELPGLSAPVTVVRDGHGIPQLYGDSIADLMRAQGYVHAQERFFEMDVRRHVTAGRLSELFGETTLETDKFVRTLGWRDVAENELALIAPDTRAALQAYADGVNAYLDGRGTSRIAVEYTMLGLTGLDYTPEEWTPADSLSWLKAMAWDLRGNMQNEITRALVGVDHTDAEVDQLFPAYPYDEHPPILTTGAVVDGVFDAEATGGSRNPARTTPAWARRTADGAAARDVLAEVGDIVDSVPALLGRGDGIGSNSWVIGGDRTTTGEPILANDPHLGVSLPGIWMQVGLHCRTVGPDCPLDVAGFSFSGVPGVVIGHNGDIAWGFTNLGPDVTDLFLERLRGDEVRYDGAWEPLTVRQETIEVRGGDDFELTIRSSRHGPLVSDVSDELSSVGANAAIRGDVDRGNGFAVALSWTALTPGTTADAILEMNLATDWDGFRAAASHFAVPAQNLVYADREGHIGYQAPGLIPIRQSGNDGSAPVEGWRPENDWTGDYVPFEALPNVLDPEEGFVVTANQAVIGEDYPFYLTDDFDAGYRSTRIRELIEADDAISVRDVEAMQADTLNPMAAVLVPYLLAVPDLGSHYYTGPQEMLRDWDGTQPTDSAPAAYYNAVWRALLRLTFHDELRESLWPGGGQQWFRVVTALLEDPDASWWDDRGTDDVVETRDDILREALRDARDDLTAHLAKRPSEWEWGRLHRLDLRTSTLGESGVAPIEWIENRGPWDVAGGSSIVNATGWEASEGYAVTTSPSMRMVVSLADFDDSRWISLTGVSGHPGSSHYVDQTDLWARDETLPWRFTADAVEASGEDTLTFEPARTP